VDSLTLVAEPPNAAKSLSFEAKYAALECPDCGEKREKDEVKAL
jgi:hypothetical protein